MSIYSNDNISKIAKLTTRELPHLVQKRKNNGLYSSPHQAVKIAFTNYQQSSTTFMSTHSWTRPNKG